MKGAGGGVSSSYLQGHGNKAREQRGQRELGLAFPKMAQLPMAAGLQFTS